MANTPLSVVLRHVGVLTTVSGDDGRLLARFVAGRDEAAFAALVQRHGPLVWNMCRRVLRHEQDAEDVFQATFLVLARRANSVRRPGALAGWLHRVAYHLAVRARAGAVRRQQCEKEAGMATRRSDAEDTWQELRPLLDAELCRLPDKYRLPLVLCYLQGRTHAQAARELGQPAGSMSRLLARGLELLRERLARRGVALPAALLGAVLAEHAVAAALPVGLAAATASAGVRFAAGASTMASARAAALAQTALKGTLSGSLQLAAALLLAVGAVAGAGVLAHEPQAPPQDEVPAGAPRTEPAQRPALDLHGDPLPAGALARLGTVRFRHAGTVPFLVFAPDGKTLALGGADHHHGDIQLCDPATGRVLRRFRGEQNDTHSCIAFSPDGKVLAVGGLTWNGQGQRVGLLTLWDTATGRELGRHLGQQADESFACLAFSPDGRTLAVGGEGVWGEVKNPQMIRLWDPATGQELRSWQGADGPLSALVFSRDGKTLISASSPLWREGNDRAVRLWDPATGRELRRLEGHQAAVRALALSPDGQTLASGSRDGTVRLWELATGRELRKLAGHANGVFTLAFSPDGRTLAAGSGYDGPALRLWDVATGRELRRLLGHPRMVLAAAFSPDGRLLASAGDDDHTVRLWDPASGREVGPVGGHQASVSAVAIAPGGRVLTVSGDERTLREWEAATGREQRRFRINGLVFCTALSADARTLAVAHADKTVRLYDWAAGKELAHCRGHTDYVRGVAFSPDGRLLASGGSDKVIRVWEVATGKEVRRFPHDDYFHSVSFSPDGTRLLYAGINSHLRVWEVASGKELFKVDQTGSPMDSVALSPDGTLLAEGKPGRVVLWDVVKGEALCELKDSEGLLIANRCSLAFSPDGRTLIVAGWDDRVRLWEVATRQVRHRLAGHAGRVAGVAFSADGRLLVTGSKDTTALVWDVTGQTAAARGPVVKLTEQELEAAWSALASDDSPAAFQAVCRLLAAPGQALALLKERARPVPSVPEERLERLLADLDSNQFAVRQKAVEELAGLKDAIEPALRRRLEGKPTPEMRRRLEQLLRDIEGPEKLRTLRVVEVLEHLGTAEARQHLEALAKGAAGAGLTREAKVVVGRLARRPADMP